MKAFRTLLLTEMKLWVRHMDGIIFGVLFPVGIVVLLGIIYGTKPAFEGADYSFIQQSFGGIIAIGICATGLMGLPLGLSDYRDKKVLKRFKVTPVRPALLLLVEVIVSLVVSILSGLAVFAVSALFFGYSMTGQLLPFLLSYLLVTLAIYGMGMLIASVSPTIKMANLLCTIVYFPMLFLSGATVPYEILPTAMQRVVDFLPLTQGIKLLKGFSLGLEVGSVLLPLCVMGGIAVICIALSVKLFKWE